MTNNKISGAQIIIEALKNEGVKNIFGYPGGAILPFYDALYQQKNIKHILAKHEQAATHAAEGYARSTGKVGIVVVTSGPGATNTITGLADAFLDSIPVICFSGQVPSNIIGTDGFQEADVTGLTRSCTKYNYLVKNTDDLGYIIHEAFHIAQTGRPGPVLIDIPKDIQNNLGIYNGLEKINRASYQIPVKSYKKIDEDKIFQVVNLLQNAKKPIIYFGGGLINSGPKASELLKKFAKLTNFPITGTLMGLGAFPTDNKNFLGMLGMHGTYEANMAMYDCDIMLNIGARFDDRITGDIKKFSPNSKKIHIDIDDVSIDKIIKVDQSIISDAANALEQINKYWKENNIKAQNLDNWYQQINEWKKIRSLSYQNNDQIIKPEFALETLDSLTKEQEPIITTDVGQHQMWAAQYMTFREPKKWLTSGGLGTMGYGVPAAGAQIANTNDLVICISGDASFLMNMQELSTIKQYNLPVKIVIINNRYMGMVRQWQELVFENRESESYMGSLPDFVKLGESFGIKSIYCDDPNKIKQKFQEMLNHNGPVLFDCVTEKSENVFPMIPAGSGHNEILLRQDQENYDQKDKNAV
jgi:acetolactate synthase-1/2/3 large subunit